VTSCKNIAKQMKTSKNRWIMLYRESDVRTIRFFLDRSSRSLDNTWSGVRRTKRSTCSFSVISWSQHRRISVGTHSWKAFLSDIPVLDSFSFRIDDCFYSPLNSFNEFHCRGVGFTALCEARCSVAVICFDHVRCCEERWRFFLYLFRCVDWTVHP
jgi:hypothetical protein